MLIKVIIFLGLTVSSLFSNIVINEKWHEPLFNRSIDVEDVETLYSFEKKLTEQTGYRLRIDSDFVNPKKRFFTRDKKIVGDILELAIKELGDALDFSFDPVTREIVIGQVERHSVKFYEGVDTTVIATEFARRYSKVSFIPTNDRITLLGSKEELELAIKELLLFADGINSLYSSRRHVLVQVYNWEGRHKKERGSVYLPGFISLTKPEAVMSFDVAHRDAFSVSDGGSSVTIRLDIKKGGFIFDENGLESAFIPLSDINLAGFIITGFNGSKLIKLNIGGF